MLHGAFALSSTSHEDTVSWASAPWIDLIDVTLPANRISVPTMGDAQSAA
jgi:hypothetical protein